MDYIQNHRHAKLFQTDVNVYIKIFNSVQVYCCYYKMFRFLNFSKHIVYTQCKIMSLSIEHYGTRNMSHLIV